MLFLASSSVFSAPGMGASTFYLVKNVHSGCQYAMCFPQRSCLTNLPGLNYLSQKLFLMGFFKNSLAKLTSKLIIDLIIVPKSQKRNLLIWEGSCDAAGND